MTTVRFFWAASARADRFDSGDTGRLPMASSHDGDERRRHRDEFGYGNAGNRLTASRSVGHP